MNLHRCTVSKGMEILFGSCPRFWVLEIDLIIDQKKDVSLNRCLYINHSVGRSEVSESFAARFDA